MGLTRLDPRTALQGGRPDKTGPADLRIRRGARGKGRVGLPRLDPLELGGGGDNLRKKQRQHRQGQDRHHLPPPRQPSRQEE